MANDILVDRAIEILQEAKRAVELLEKAANILIDRDKSYNSNGIKYEDFQLHGLESCFGSILECFVRLYNTKKEDPGVDWVAYSALMAALTERGIPVSRFSIVFNKTVPEMYKALKERDMVTPERG